VDAYGMPVDEIKMGIDLLVWPMSLPDQKLNPKVLYARQALALDDERNTFHPLLWDENDVDRDDQGLPSPRIRQVWFAGMHANVGGGYPDDSLALVPFSWMVDEIRAVEKDKREDERLGFAANVEALHRARRDPIGRMYDSRAGLRSYYRYNPRGIPNCNRSPITVHHSVFDRIAAAPEAYAPIVLPSSYRVLNDKGGIEERQYETAKARNQRQVSQSIVWNLVWARRRISSLQRSLGLLQLLSQSRANVPR